MAFHAPRHHQKRPFRPAFRRRGDAASGIGPDVQPLRIRTQRPGELLGKVVELHGGSRMSISCEDGHARMCRIPGKVRRKILITVGDICAVKPWTVETDEKGDIEFRYTRVQADQLRQKGLLKGF